MEIVLSLVAAFATAYTIIYSPFSRILTKISKSSTSTTKTVTPEVVKKTTAETKNKTVAENFIPEDSMLKRHYLTHLQTLTNTQTPTQKIVETLQCQPIIIPEDSMLKRHFLTNLRASIESELSPRPTCSTLSRHHDALVVVEMDKRLQIAA
ncbi:MAG: hypothetical protein KAG26_00280 [Methylococcales bacterium]|nr:hypothetical protein [Methylococcales bacterium]